jgi:tetratricopeptide (TPR) repeat protein
MVDDLEAVIVTGELSVEDVTIFDRAEEMIEVIANDPAGEIVDEAEEGIEAGDPLSAALASNPIIAEAEVPAPTPAKQPSYLNDAVAFMIELTRLAPANDGAWDTLGNLYRASGCYAEAIESFQQAISLDMNNEEYFYHLGLAFAGQDRHEEAIAAFERTIALKPDHSMAHSALAGHYRKVGRDAESIKHIKQALPKLTDEQDYSRACFEAISGNTDLAIALLQAALEKKQITMEWVRRDPDLDFIRNDPRYISIVGD